MSRKDSVETTLAERADRHVCYQRSVQAPDADLEFFAARFRERSRRTPTLLREDFCGTALLSSAWLAGGARRRALCIDLDPEAVEWGKAHNLGDPLARRATICCADVRDVRSPVADIACAMNFSFCVFKERRDLERYFSAVHAGLAEDGLFVCELYGGTEAIVALEERRSVDDFTFVWEQADFNPITHETHCYIHFEFGDGSRLDKAFTYDWRLWSIPEVMELLQAAGFSAVEVWWQSVDDQGEGTGEYLLTTREENQEGWLVLIVATK